jgi:hypothetical protein
MKTIFYYLAILFLVGTYSCSQKATGSATSSVQASERDGSSFEKAIIIKEKTEGSGVSAEYKWLKENYPGYRSVGQSLSHHDGKPFDIIRIKTSGGAEKSIYFDISNYFGKW